MLRPATALSAEEVTCLEACSQHGPHPRMRRRPVLGHHRGQTVPQLAALFAVRYATVHGWVQAWHRAGLAGLAEGRRAGRPSKLAPAAQKK
jgi:transposase